MSLGEEKLKISLNEAINAWIDEESNTDEWSQLGHITHPDLSTDMANAAFSVLKAVYSSQKYAKSEGYLVDAD